MKPEDMREAMGEEWFQEAKRQEAQSPMTAPKPNEYVACAQCAGRGAYLLHHYESLQYSTAPARTEWKTCVACKGSGLYAKYP